MMKKKILALSLLSIALVACSKPTHNTSDDVKAVNNNTNTASAPAVPDQHTAESSLDWAGEYKGLFPCADCEGIETELELKADKTYELKEEYKGGKGDGTKNEVKGTFQFDSKNPSIITLDASADHRKFFVGENFVEARDIQTGEKLSDTLDYKLQKELH
ncbi:Lipoprotein NlpE precursor [Acinetobacter stercoris]|uniref:Lipoprotein NlpE n=2 Tax=Acinetobacter stercoris TaxID=2126983 RepID=A0A2U3N316_9GAMM|nr:Lipoprotein NlpE precursor [Acinetobacter stercoris]